MVGFQLTLQLVAVALQLGDPSLGGGGFGLNLIQLALGIIELCLGGLKALAGLAQFAGDRFQAGRLGITFGQQTIAISNEGSLFGSQLRLLRHQFTHLGGRDHEFIPRAHQLIANRLPLRLQELIASIKLLNLRLEVEYPLAVVKQTIDQGAIEQQQQAQREGRNQNAGDDGNEHRRVPGAQVKPAQAHFAHTVADAIT